MALNYEDLETEIKGWVTVTLEDIPCVWENARRPFLGKFPIYVILGEPTDIVGVGEDYVSFSEDPEEEDNLIPDVIGSRLFTIPIRVCGRSQTAARSARLYADTLKTSLKKPSVLDYFKESEIAIVRCGPIAEFPVEFDGRMESIAAFDLRLCAPLATDPDSSLGTIGTIELSSTVKNADGTTFPVPPNLEDFPIEVDP